jgi:hypothetical protein
MAAAATSEATRGTHCTEIHRTAESGRMTPLVRGIPPRAMAWQRLLGVS